MADDMIGTSESPGLDDSFFGRATLHLPKPVSVSPNVAAEVLAWFEAQGDSAKLMNAALGIYAEAHRKAL